MKLSTASLTLATILLQQTLTSHAFTLTPLPLTSPSPLTSQSASPLSSRIYQSASNEESLRDELKQKTTLVDAKDEIKYDSGVSGDSTASTTSTTESKSTATSSSTSSSSNSDKIINQTRLERILKPRSYPLFLAEKAALITEDIFDSLFQSNTSKNQELSQYELYKQKESGITKEKIVILGTGWGSAAFLKDIDTNIYDVTVISPRNFFLFTPM
jgi:hypothetical protein